MKKLYLISLLFLTGCSSLSVDPRRGFAPQNPAIIAASQSVGANANSQVLIRIFKESRELELWRKNSSGTYAFVKTYNICNFSGNLGPKIKEGDFQAPEGFYTVKPHYLNYYSSQFLSFNTGYPNEFDRSHGRTGSFLMIHGGCSSSGCYAIEDAPAQELFTVVRDAFKAGQKEIQLHIYPFKLSNINLYNYKTNKNLDFWLQLRSGYDIFNKDKKDLSIKVVNKRYVIN